MKTKTTKPKSRIMWANYYPIAGIGSTPRIHPTQAQAMASAAGCAKPVRVAVIPLDDVEAIVERAEKAYWADYMQSMAGDLILLRAALTAAGIPCKRKARK